MPPSTGTAAGQFPSLPELKKTGWLSLVAFVSAGGIAAIEAWQGADLGPMVNGLLTVAGAAAIDFLSRWLTDTRNK